MKPSLSWDGLLEELAASGAPVVIETASGARVVVVAEKTFLARREAASAAASSPDPASTSDSTTAAVAGPSTDRLTKREIGILSSVASGKSGSQVAADLGLAANTVAQHLVSVRRKLGVSTTAAAIEVARESGLL